MKKILFGIMSIVLCVGLMGAAFASFSDTATSTGNRFAAGTLDVNCVISGTGNGASVNENADGTNDYVTFSNLKPGDAGSITWTITNTGSLPGSVMIHRTLINDYDGVNTGPEMAIEGSGITATTPGELAKNMWLSSTCTINGVSTFDNPPYSNWMYLEGTYGPNQFDHLPKILTSGSTLQVTYAWSIPIDVGNIIQGDTFTLNFTIDLDQIP
jgi:predicted ribosomally synthesized peptide with SipW-like signal peptide